MEILLDSGADSSVLPLSCGHVGHSISLDASSRFVDAQGAPLGVSDKRVAELVLGDVAIREQFIVAPVTGPIVCLVKLLKAGWEFQRVMVFFICARMVMVFLCIIERTVCMLRVSFRKSHRYQVMVQLHLEL